MSHRLSVDDLTTFETISVIASASAVGKGTKRIEIVTNIDSITMLPISSIRVIVGDKAVYDGSFIELAIEEYNKY